ncbi:MAG TPA: aspartyl protease family protein [Chthonomonadales bacterium]|nr:aspartyl protease family protein [Chthonomonadales bacterium]
MERLRISILALWLLVFASLCLPQAGSTQAASPLAARIEPTSTLPQTVPFELRNGLIVLKVALGSGLPLDAVLSTGLPLCVVSTRVAQKNSFYAEGMREIPVLHGVLRVPGTSPKELRIGGLHLSRVGCAVCDLWPHVSAQTMPDLPEVWLGNSALGALHVTIDPVKKEILFDSPGRSLPSRAVVVPFELKDGRMWVEAKANGKVKYSAILDTSVRGTLLPATKARVMNLTTGDTVRGKLPGGKEFTATHALVEELALGTLKVKNVPALYITESSDLRFNAEQAIIGNDVLLRYRVTIDYEQRKIAFEELPSPMRRPMDE